MGQQTRRHGVGKALAINRQRPACRDLMGVTAGHDHAVQQPHLRVQQAHGIVFPVVRPEGVGTDQLGQAIGVVGIGHNPCPAHLVQHDRHPGLGDLPGGFGTGQAATDNMDRI